MIDQDENKGIWAEDDIRPKLSDLAAATHERIHGADLAKLKCAAASGDMRAKQALYDLDGVPSHERVPGYKRPYWSRKLDLGVCQMYLRRETQTGDITAVFTGMDDAFRGKGRITTPSTSGAYEACCWDVWSCEGPGVSLSAFRLFIPGSDKVHDNVPVVIPVYLWPNMKTLARICRARYNEQKALKEFEGQSAARREDAARKAFEDSYAYRPTLYPEPAHMADCKAEWERREALNFPAQSAAAVMDQEWLEKVWNIGHRVTAGFSNTLEPIKLSMSPMDMTKALYESFHASQLYGVPAKPNVQTATDKAREAVIAGYEKKNATPTPLMDAWKDAVAAAQDMDALARCGCDVLSPQQQVDILLNGINSGPLGDAYLGKSGRYMEPGVQVMDIVNMGDTHIGVDRSSGPDRTAFTVAVSKSRQVQDGIHVDICIGDMMDGFNTNEEESNMQVNVKQLITKLEAAKTAVEEAVATERLMGNTSAQDYLVEVIAGKPTKSKDAARIPTPASVAAIADVYAKQLNFLGLCSTDVAELNELAVDGDVRRLTYLLDAKGVIASLNRCQVEIVLK